MMKTHSERALGFVLACAGIVLTGCSELRPETAAHADSPASASAPNPMEITRRRQFVETS